MAGVASAMQLVFYSIKFQANLGKVRQDIETQARQIMMDVVEDFSTVRGVQVNLK